MLGKKLRLAEYFIVTTGLFISLLPGLAEAYPTYSGCAECHGEFNTGNYTSRHDETVWGHSLMDLHMFSPMTLEAVPSAKAVLAVMVETRILPTIAPAWRQAWGDGSWIAAAAPA